MKVLITGCVGFLGTHVAEYFRSQNWDVVGIDNLTNYELIRTGFDCKKAKKDFGWEPTIFPVDGIKKLLDWCNANQEIL